MPLVELLLCDYRGRIYSGTLHCVGGAHLPQPIQLSNCIKCVAAAARCAERTDEDPWVRVTQPAKVSSVFPTQKSARLHPDIMIRIPLIDITNILKCFFVFCFGAVCKAATIRRFITMSTKQISNRYRLSSKAVFFSYGRCHFICSLSAPHIHAQLWQSGSAAA